MGLFEDPGQRALRPSEFGSRGVGESARRSIAARLLAAAVWVSAGKLLGLWLQTQPVFSMLGLTSVTFVTASALFGWPGLAMGLLLQLLVLGAVEGLAGIYPWASLVAYGAAGALSWATFRYVPGLTRSFANWRTAIGFALSGVAGALVSSAIVCAAGSVDDFWAAVAVWSRSTVVSVLVFGPPLIILAERSIRPFLAVVPGESSHRPPRHIELVRPSRAGVHSAAAGVVISEQSSAWVLLAAAGACLAITACRVLLFGAWGEGGAWFNGLYLGLVWWVAQRLRLPGALLTGGMVAAAGLITRAIAAHHEPQLPASEVLVIYALMLSIAVFAALIGGAAAREGELLEGLTELHGRLRQDLQVVVRALASAVEAKDTYTGGHQQRVNAYAVEVGRRLGLAEHDLEVLEIASTLHDLGKIGIPESILNKPGPLDVTEREIIERHAEIGAQLLDGVEELREAVPLVLHHQERWDGRSDVPFPGYPRGIHGEKIPIGARIIAVVDSFDAMTTNRPYRRAKSVAAARAVLLAERGAQFDPCVVDTFCQVLDELPWEDEGGALAAPP